jgi:hypothetical protein
MVAQVATYFAEILQEVAENEEIRMERIAVRSQELGDDLAESADAREVFAF